MGSFSGDLAASHMTPEELHLRASHAAHTSWAHTEDRPARTSKARQAFDQKFYDEVDPDRVLPAKEREKRAKNARQAYFAGLALKAATAARKRREASPDD
jgi:hypothetical protein